MPQEVVIGLFELYRISGRCLLHSLALGNNDGVTPNPLTNEEATMFMTVKISIYLDQLNDGFSKVCRICGVCSIGSLKYIQEFYTPVRYCGDISTPINITRHMVYLSVIWPLGWAFAFKVARIPRPSAVTLKVWP